MAATVAPPLSSSLASLPTPQPSCSSAMDNSGSSRKKLRRPNATTAQEILSLFFAQYQTFEERYPLRAEPTTTTMTTTPTTDGLHPPPAQAKKDKGKEKLTEEEEAAIAAEEESGEEGVLDSLHVSMCDDDSIDLLSDDYYFECGEEEYDEESALLLEVDLFNEEDQPSQELDFYSGHDFDMLESEMDVVLHEESERWERRVVSCKLGGHVVKRHSRAHKKRRCNPERWISARDDKRGCTRAGHVLAQTCAAKANATRGLVYRSIDYQAIRQEIIVPSSSSAASPSFSSAPHNACTTSHRSSSSRNHDSSSSSSNPRVPSYERELTSAIDRGGAVQCGLSAQQLNDLLNRELTPEDYELLLMLDSTVKPKTLSANLIDSFPSRTVESGSPLLHGDERCAICLCAFELGEGLKELPRCQHSFHAECIVQWLSTASTKCPLCGCLLEA